MYAYTYAIAKNMNGGVLLPLWFSNGWWLQEGGRNLEKHSAARFVGLSSRNLMIVSQTECHKQN
jgi:hypothetical protein